MSFYLGTDTSNKKVMHITKGVNTIPQLKSGVLSNTIFHSSLPYLDIKELPVSRAASSGYTHAILSSTDANWLGANNIAYCFVVDNNVYSGGSYLDRNSFYSDSNPWDFKGIETQIAFGTWSATYPNFGWSFDYKPSSTYMVYTMNGSYSTVRCFAFKNIVNKVYVPKSPSNHSVLIKNSGIIVNGINLIDYGYVNKGQINNVDKVANIPGQTVQFINSGASGSLSIMSNQTKTEILKGDKALFSTLGEGKIAYRGESSTSFPGYMRKTRSSSALTETRSVPFSSLGISSQSDLSFFYAYATVSRWNAVGSGSKEFNYGIFAGNQTSNKRIIYHEEYAHNQTMSSTTWSYTDYWSISDDISYYVTSSGITFRRSMTWWADKEYYFPPISIKVIAFG